MFDTTRIGETIRELRKEKGYRQEELAKAIGYSKSVLSKIENGKISPTLDILFRLAEKLGVNLEYILCDTLDTEDYQLAAIKSFIERFVRITTINEYFNGNNDSVLNPEEFIFSLLADTENPLIIQMDKNLLNFVKSVAEAENSKQTLKSKEYDNRILSALRDLHKAKPNKEINCYCLASIQDIDRIIKKAVEKEINGLRAIQGEF